MNPSNILRWTPTFVFSCLDYLCGDESKNTWNHQRIVMGRTSSTTNTCWGSFIRNILWAHHEVQLTLAVPPTGNLGVLKKGPIVKRVTCQIHNRSDRFGIRHTLLPAVYSSFVSSTGLMGIPDTTKSLSLHVIFPYVWKNWLRNKSCQWDKQVNKQF